MKKNKGITLIALVITIIVLLILAGVTINAIVGNESSMQKAKQAKIEDEKGNELDTIKLAVTDAMVKETDGTIHLNKLNESLTGIVKGEATGDSPWIVTGNTGYKYRITSYGDVQLFSGVSIEPKQVKFVLGTTIKTAELTGTLTEDLSGKEIEWSSNNADVTLSNETGINTIITLSNNVTNVIDPVTVTAKTVDNVGEAGRCKVMVVNNVQNAIVNALIGETGTTVDVSKEITNKDQIEDIKYSSTSSYVTVEENTGKVTVKQNIGGTTARITIVLTGAITGLTKSVNMDLTAPPPPIGEYVEYDVSYVDMYSDTDLETTGLQSYTFTKSDGWRIVSVGEKNSNGDYTNVKIISTGIPAQLYYDFNVTQDAKPNWWGNDDDVRELYNTSQNDYTTNGYIAADGGYPNRYAAAGMRKNFELIPFTKKDKVNLSPSDLTPNTGGYREIVNAEASTTETGGIFKNSKASEICLLYFGVDTNKDLYSLKKLNKYGYNNNTHYTCWIAAPSTYYENNFPDSGLCHTVLSGTGGFGYQSSYPGGVRPVITLNSPIYKDGDIWKIR